MDIVRDHQDYYISAIKSSERRWALGFAALVLFATTLPYLIGYAVQGTDWRFTGFVFGVEDGNSYLAKMISGAAGAWLFRTPYTVLPQNGVIAFLPYLLLGKLAAPPALHEQLVVLFHLFRIGAGFLAILATYDFIAFFIPDIRLRRFGLALAILGGGLGWILVLLGRSVWLGSLPLEFYSPETFGFLGLFGVPHLALARAGLLWGLLAYLQGVRRIYASPDLQIQPPEIANRSLPLWRQGLKTGLFWLLTALAQPLTALIFGGVIGLHLLVLAVTEKKSGRRWLENLRLAVYSFALPAPFILYNVLAFEIDPFLKSWTAQNLILSPNPFHYPLAYGLLIPFAILGGKSLLKRNSHEGWLLVAWALAIPVLAYLPFNLQRRLPESAWVALVVLAMISLEDLKLRRFKPLLFLAFPSTLILLAGGILSVLRPSLPLFRPSQEVAAFQFIQANVPAGEHFLTSYETGNALPAWAPVMVLAGHGPESAGLAGLLPRLKQFYSEDETDAARLDLIHQFGVQDIFWGPAERALGSWDPGKASFLKSIYKSGDYQIYQVLRKD